VFISRQSGWEMPSTFAKSLYFNRSLKNEVKWKSGNIAAQKLGNLATSNLILMAKWEKKGLHKYLGVYSALFNKSQETGSFSYKLVNP
jgi:hypothetical protein